MFKSVKNFLKDIQAASEALLQLETLGELVAINFLKGNRNTTFYYKGDNVGK